MRIDIGLPLTKKEEFDQFYIDSNSEQFIRYKTWLETDRSEPLMIAGQIGSGKTTFIHYGCVASSINPTIQIKFDTESVSFTIEGFIALIFAKTLQWLTTDWKAKIEDITSPEIKELFPEIVEPNFIGLLSNKRLGSKERTIQKRLFKVIKAEHELVLDHIDELLNLVDLNFRKDVIIFAEGIDKFQPNTPEFFELEPVLEILKRHKTLFETNLVHYFSPSKIWEKYVKKVIIPTADPDHITNCLKKRLGQFHVVYTNEIEQIAKLSGGNYRQAVRLLSEYEFASTNLNKPKDEAIEYAIKRTVDNFLSYSSVFSNLETLSIIQRDRFITSGVAQQYNSLIFNNHVLIQNEMTDLKWKCIVNPLLTDNLERTNPEDRNLEPIRTWSAVTGTTMSGLSNSSLSIEQLEEYLTSFKTKPLNISEAFTALSSLFLSRYNEIVILLYNNKEVADIANDYFIGNVGNVTDLKFNKILSLKTMDDILSIKDNIDASILILDNYQIKFLKELDHSRDLLITKNMLWWIKQEELFHCLENWPQLRQFMKIYSFDESILSFLAPEEIEEDIEALKDMGYKEKTYKVYKERLERVLKYLKRGGSHA